MPADGDRTGIDGKLRLYQVRISGFKALTNFRLDIAKHFTLLIGGNGAGKSSILQALGFLRYLVEGRGQSFFEERGWDPQDLRFRSNPRARRTVVSVATLFEVNGAKVRWDAEWGLNGGTLFRELVRRRKSEGSETETLLKFEGKEGGKLLGELEIPAFSVTGSIIPALDAMLDSGIDGDLIRSLANWAMGIRSLELLSPHAMKGGTRLSPHDIGIKGDRLAGFLASLTPAQKARVVARLQRLYPIDELTTTRKRAGWIDMQIAEHYNNMSAIPVAHMSDGFMRLLALCSIPELGDQATLILLDELEDGIEPHILPRLVDLVIQESSAQFVATSHSPLLVNHIGVEDVRFIAREEAGATTAKPISEMPAFSIGSDFFGAGEMWTSSPLDVLQSEAKVAPSEAVDEENQGARRI